MPTLTLQPDAAAGKDTLVISTIPTFNFGISPQGITSVVSRGLFFFDLSSISSSATCISAIFTLYQVNSGVAGAFTLTAYAIAAGNAGWIEGTKSGALAGAGEPCWNAKAADGAGGVTTAWAGTAGLNTATTDYLAAALGTVSGNHSDPNGTPYSMSLTASVVQGWFGAVNTNYGIIVRVGAVSGGIGLSDHATAAYRPKLVVDYTLPGGLLLRANKWGNKGAWMLGGKQC